MARDWRKVALAVLAAIALASVCVLGPSVEAQQARQPSAKANKAPPKAEPQDNEEGDEGEAKVPAKKKRQDPAEAQRSIEGANKLLQAGKTDQATVALTSTLAGGNLPPAIMARALYLRGLAYRQQSKPAQAISDLTGALWLKGGLTAEDRQDALKQRSGAYADAGLTENGEVAARPPAAAKEGTERPAAKSWGVVTTPTDNAPATTTQTAEGSGNNWFKNWFNSASASSPPANTAPPATASIDKADATPRAPPPVSSARVASAWSSTTQVKPETAPSEVRSPNIRPAAEARAPTPPPVHAEGKYRVQLATVRTQQEAAAVAVKAKRALAGMAAREPEIDQTVLGNMGSFYRVRIGPFATVQETQAVCAKVKGTGLDCMTVTQ
jgi:SPOR domain